MKLNTVIMNKLFTLFTSLMLINQLHAQITIINTDMPRSGDTARYTTSSSSFNVNQTGANFTWNATALQPNTQDVLKFNSPLQSAYALYFSQASFGIAEDNMSISMMAFQDNVGFYRNSTSAQVYMGRGVSLQGIPLGITYSPRDTVYRFPLQYNKMDSSVYAAETNITLGTLKVNGKRVNHVDGWGTITTPLGTFNCIRVKSVITETDTIIFSGFPIGLQNNRIEYKWLAKGLKYPVLQVVTTTGINPTQTITYADVYRPELFVNNARFSANRTTTQIGDTINFTNQSFGNPVSFSWNITPNTFRFVGGTGATSQNPRIIFDALGKYSVKLTTTYTGGKDDTLRTDYINVVEGVKANFYADKTITDPSVVVNFFDSSTGSPTTYLWTISPNTASFVGGTTNASKNPKLVFNTPGNYNITLRATGSAGSNTITKNNYIVVWPTSINKKELQSNNIILYPNPVKNYLQILFDHKPKDMQIELYDILGKQKQVEIIKDNFNATEINTAALANGIYFVKIICNNQEDLIKKFIKE